MAAPAVLNQLGLNESLQPARDRRSRQSRQPDEIDLSDCDFTIPAEVLSANRKSRHECRRNARARASCGREGCPIEA